MSGTAQIIRLCAIVAVVCFAALVAISKLWIEPAGLVIFDSRLAGYSMDDAQAFLAAITPAQTLTYLGLFRWIDTVFPVLLAISLVGTIWLNTAGERPLMRRVALLGPSAYLVLDLRENSLVSGMLRAGMSVTEATVLSASTYTQAKWMCLALSVVVMIWAWRFAAKEHVA